MNDHSQLNARTLPIVFPIILLFGFYVIINGHVSPGGGFQGGAILASVFIAKYLGNPIKTLNLYTVQNIEKILLLSLFVLMSVFVTLSVYMILKGSLVYYIIFANMLIGLKVACGFTIIFYRFVFYESR